MLRNGIITAVLVCCVRVCGLTIYWLLFKRLYLISTDHCGTVNFAPITLLFGL